MTRWRVAVGVVLVLLVAGVAVYADYPGVTYNYWVDFENAALGVAPTTSTLAASSHGTGESWLVSNPDNALTVVSNAQSGIAGATGNRGLQYSNATGGVDYVGMFLPSTQNTVSMGMWYCTSNQSASGYAFSEGPHFFGFYNNAFGATWRLSDERNSGNNVRSIRLSPTGPDAASLRMIPVSDNTCYWVSMKYVKGSTVIFNLYDTSLNLLGSVNTTESDNVGVDLVWLGNQQQTTVNLPYTMQMDDMIIDYTNAKFPLLPVSAPPSVGAVPTFAGNAQHTSAYTPTSQDLGRVKWTTSVNSNTGGAASRYASPVITAANTVVAPSQIAGGAFQLNAFTGATGASLYALSTDYVAPTSTITPVYQPVLVNTASGTRLYYAGAGGTILYIANPDSATPGTPVRQVFYTTLSDYQTRAASFNSTVFINTPLTADANGDIFFGFRVQGTAPSPLGTQDGFARIDTNGNGTFVLAGTAAADAAVSHDAQNSAPALSNDGTTVYVAAKSASNDDYAYLLGLDSTALTTKYRVLLTDPRNGNGAGVVDGSTASPTVGPDNDVYFGTMANPDNGSRGFLLHFSSDLTITKTPGAFGWDNTPAIVSTSMVSSYTGSSAYLLLSNYNDYVGQVDGQGVNKVALLDPNATEIDSHPSSNGLSVMREILDAASPTPDAANQNSTFPSAMLPWLGNAFAVNAPTKTVILPSSDGNLYRWNVSTNSISQFLNLGAAGSQQNVPTVIGPDGSAYTISGSTLVSVQGLSGVGVNVTSSNADERTLAAGQNVTFTATVSNGGGSGTPTGAVTFNDTVSTVVSGSLSTTTNSLGSASINSGIATLSPVTLSAGNHFITAQYNGDGTFPAGSGGLVQVVHAGASATTVTATPNPSNVGQSVAFNVAVTSVPVGGAAPTGQVTLTQGSTVLTQLTLQNGIASFATSALPAGSTAITASYSGDSSYSASTGNVTAVVQSPTLTSLSSSSNPASQGQSVTFTASVTSSGGTPIGSVTFTDGATVLASNVAVNTSGVATLSTSALATGTHSIGASFTGSTGWQNSSSGTLTEQINQTSFATSTTVTSSPNPSNSGQSVAFTATVTSTNGTPSGSVTFADGATVLASSVAVNTGGQATFSTSTLSVGSHTITASFTGANGFGTSSGTSTPQVVQSVSNPGFPGITYDDWVDFEGVAVGAAPAATTLANSTHGTVGTWTVTNAKGSLSAIAAAQDPMAGSPGTRGIQYSAATGDPQDFMQFALPKTQNQVSLGMYYCTSNQSSSVFNFEEGPHFLGFSSNSFGDLWRLVDERNSVDNSRSIRISPTGPQNSVKINVADNTCYWLAFRYVKSGTVDFSLYDTNLNLIQHVSTPETFGQTVDNLFLGNDLANGDSQTFYTFRFDDLIVDYTNANFPLLPTTGAPVNPTVAIASSQNPANVGQSVTFTATVTPAASGTASFSDGSTVLASGVAVTSGQATFTTSTLAAGSHTISTTFTPTSGTPTTATLTQSILTQAATSTALTSSSNPATAGQSVTFTATVSSTSGTPVGSVTFTDGATVLASNVAVNTSGIATFSSSALATGSHTVGASFTGSIGWQNSSGSLTEQINQSSFATSTTVTSSPNPSNSNQSVTFTATVTSTGGTPVGSVTFTEGATALASNVAVNASGQATFSTSTLSVGSHTITASFTGANGFGSSSGTAAPQVVQNVAAGFPGIPYDMWADFEAVGVGAAPTATNLANSTHGAAGSWQVVNSSGSLSAIAAAQDTVAGSAGTRGMQYNSPSNNPPDHLVWTLPATKTQVSLGMYYCTSNQSSSVFNFQEGPHFLGFASNSFGDLWRLVDERNAIDNSRSIRISPTGPVGSVKINVADNTCYWLAFRYVKSGTVDFSLYDTNLNLIQHVSTPETFGQNVDTLFLGSDLESATASTFYNLRFDDLIVDYTNATFPLLPASSAPVNPTVALTSSLNPANAGQSVTFTATVTPAASGTASFSDGSTVLASGVAVTNGVATFTTSTLAAGSHTIGTTFTPTSGTPSTASLTQTVNATTSTTLTSSANPSTSGQSVTFTATVASSAGTPTGSVTFTDGATTLASNVAVTAGTATFTTSALASSSHSITATFTGTGNYIGSTSNTVSQVVQGGNSTTTVTSSANPSGPGQSVTFTATISSSNGTPTGSVTFTDGATTLASGVAVSAGKAAFTTSTLAVATHTITASFTGTAGFSNSTGSVSQSVQGTTTTVVTSSVSPSTFGQSITLTATIAGVGTSTPTGTVKFTDGTTTLATAATVTAGKATFTSSTLAVGSHSITAAYTGTGGFTSSSGTLTQTVQIGTTTSVASSLNPSNPAQSVTFTATVTSTNGIPTGTMAFLDGTTTLASGVAVSTTTGRATFATSSLASGTHSIKAVFTGSAGWLGSTSTAINQVVNAATTTTVTASPSPQTTGLSVTITATVTSSGGTPTGTVTFKSGATTLASNVALSAGKASITTTTLATGTNTITATYNAASGFVTSTGTTTEVMQADTTPPSTPTNVAAVSGPSTRQITVSWTASSDNVGVKDYEVFRATTATGTFTLAATVTTTSFTDTQTASGLTRFYFVVAVDTTNHTSANSAHVSATSK
jgi:large repetitive protein